MTDLPQMQDHDDKTVELLGEILDELRGSGVGGDDVTINKNVGTGSGGQSPVARIDPTRVIIIETAALEDSNPDGTITIQPGEKQKIVEYHTGGDHPINLLALGATDRQNVSYRVVYDNDQTLGGWTQSPLGAVHDPFSLVETYGLTIPVERRVGIEAMLSESADSSVDLIGRLHTHI